MRSDLHVKSDLLVDSAFVEWFVTECFGFVTLPVLLNHCSGLWCIPVKFLPLVYFVIDHPILGSFKGQGLATPEPQTGNVQVTGDTTDNA